LSRDATTGANKLAHGRWGLSHKQIMVAFGVSAIKSSRFTEALSAMSLEYPSLDFAEAVNLVKQAAVERAGSSDTCEPKDVKKATTMASSAHKLSANATLELIPACEVDSTLWKGDNDNQYQARNNHNHSGVSPSTSGIPKQAMRASLISSLSTPASTSVSVPGGTDDSSLSYDTSSSSSFTDPANKSRNCTADPHVQPELTMEKKALSTPLPQAQQSATAPLTPISNGPKRPMRDEGEGQPPHKLPRLEADLTTPEYISSSPPSVCPERVPQSLQSWAKAQRRCPVRRAGLLCRQAIYCSSHNCTREWRLGRLGRNTQLKGADSCGPTPCCHLRTCRKALDPASRRLWSKNLIFVRFTAFASYSP
jgi:hypothetical protein